MGNKKKPSESVEATKRQETPVSYSHGQIIGALGIKQQPFLLLLLLPLLSVPLIVKKFGPYDGHMATLLDYFFNAFYLVVASGYCYAIGLRLRKESPKIKYGLLLFALLYGQISFLTFWLINSEVNFVRIFLISVSIGSFIVLLARPSYNWLLALGIIYFALVMDTAMDYYFRVYFNSVEFNLRTFVYYLGQSITWIGNCLCIILLIAKNDFKPSKYAPSLRYASGLAVFIVVITFAHLYQNLSLFTRGDAFEYSKKSIRSQWKRSLAKEFPGLPSRVYENLIREYENPDKYGGLIKVKDHISGMTQYSAPAEESIGTAWADFYEELLKARGATHFRIIKHTGPIGLTANNNAYDLLLYDLNKSSRMHRDGEWRELPEVRVFEEKLGQPYEQYVIYLPKHMIYNSDSHLSSDPTPPSPKTIDMVCGPNKSLLMRTWITKGSGFGFEYEIYERYLLGADILAAYLCHSHAFLDDSVTKVQHIVEDHYLNSFIDYLYFSVATISTTGYGDITPIDPKVQLLTVAEIALGWLLLLIFGSLLIKGINERPN